MSSRYPNASELRLCTAGSPDDPAVVFIPSLGRDRADFEPLITPCIDAGFQAVTFAPRGVANGPPGTGQETLHDLAQDVAQIVRSVGPSARLVGHAFGSRVARCLATDQPELVQQVILLSCGGLVDPGPEIHAARRRAMLAPSESEQLEALSLVFFASGSDPSVWLDGWWPEAIRVHSKANQRTPFHEWWYAGTCPIVIIQGTEDRDAVPANGELMQKLLGDRVTLVSIDSAGHALVPERPDDVARAMVTALRAHTG